MKIVIHGAGSIGCFIGGLLRNAGRQVTFLARPRIADELKRHGLHLSDFTGLNVNMPDIDVRTSTACLRDVDLIILAVKSSATAAAAEEIARESANAAVLSLQNGVDNVPLLRTNLPGRTILGGMVAFNVAHQGSGHFHRGTSGDVVIEGGREDIASLLSVPGLQVVVSSNMAEFQWGKLVINLNNALNALSGLALKAEIEDRAWRGLLADQIAEALTVLSAAGIKARGVTKVPIHFLPTLLRLPNGIFHRIAKPLVQIDPDARSSMWDDLQLRRATEIQYLQGVIVRLAREHSLKAPISERVMGLVRQAEEAGSGPPGLSAKRRIAWR